MRKWPPSSRWLLWAQWSLLAVIFAAGVLLRLELVRYPLALRIFTSGGLAVLAVSLTSMPVFIWGLVKRRADTRRNAIWASMLGLLPVAAPLLTVGGENFDAPRICDITTDTRNPPRYQVVFSLRGEGDHSPEYGGEAVAAQQRGAEIYGDIRPLYLEMSLQQSTELAAQVVEELGWKLVALEPQNGHLEAVARSTWLGLVGDVVVRIRPVNGRLRVDVRSSSRVGTADLGANAKHIRRFLKALAARAQARGQDGGAL